MLLLSTTLHLNNPEPGSKVTDAFRVSVASLSHAVLSGGESLITHGKINKLVYGVNCHFGRVPRVTALGFVKQILRNQVIFNVCLLKE
jgi:hypothetical protein